MKERGILFSDAMVRAILAGKKWQTRRAVKPQPTHQIIRSSDDGEFYDADCIDPGRHVRCPYGAPGTNLWLREAHAIVSWADGKGGESKKPIYRADKPGPRVFDARSGDRWTPSLLMPRWASRITLEVTGVRVERAQAISDADVDAEGVDAEAVEALLKAAPKKRRAETWPVVSDALHDDWIGGMRPADRWRAAWCLINGRESWDANPWCWVIEFKRVDAGGAK